MIERKRLENLPCDLAGKGYRQRVGQRHKSSDPPGRETRCDQAIEWQVEDRIEIALGHRRRQVDSEPMVKKGERIVKVVIPKVPVCILSQL